MKLGTPKYEQSKKNYFTFKKDQNSFILRILPPMGKLADKGKFSIFHRVEFGYKGTDNRMKPFLSPRKVNYEKMVEVESFAHLKREKIKATTEEARKSGNKVLEESGNTLLRTYNQDAKHYMNAIDLQGNIGLFKIGHRGYQAFKAEIDRLMSEGVDPVGIDNGRFFVFSRSGTGRDTIYTAVEYKQKQEMDNNGVKMVVDVPFPHAINEAIMSKLETDAFELLDVYPTVSSEEEKLIVEGGPAGVDTVFNARKAAKNPASATPEVAKSETPAPVQPVVQATTTVTPEATAEVSLDPVTDAAIENSTPAPANDVASMSEDDFFKMVDKGNF